MEIFNKGGYLSGKTLMQMVACNIFSFSSSNQQLPMASLNKYKCTKPYNDALQFSLLFFDRFVTHFTEGIPKHLHQCFGPAHLFVQWLSLNWNTVLATGKEISQISDLTQDCLTSLCKFVNVISAYDEGDSFLYSTDSIDENQEFAGFFPLKKLYKDKIFNIGVRMSPKELFYFRKSGLINFLTNTSSQFITFEKGIFSLRLEEVEDEEEQVDEEEQMDNEESEEYEVGVSRDEEDSEEVAKRKSEKKEKKEANKEKKSVSSNQSVHLNLSGSEGDSEEEEVIYFEPNKESKQVGTNNQASNSVGSLQPMGGSQASSLNQDLVSLQQNLFPSTLFSPNVSLLPNSSALAPSVGLLQPFFKPQQLGTPNSSQNTQNNVWPGTPFNKELTLQWPFANQSKLSLWNPSPHNSQPGEEERPPGF